jgi:hypothetical protein
MRELKKISTCSQPIPDKSDNIFQISDWADDDIIFAYGLRRLKDMIVNPTMREFFK